MDLKCLYLVHFIFIFFGLGVGNNGFFYPLLLIFNLGFAFIILPLFLFLVSNSGFGLCLLSRFGFRSSRSGFGLGLLFIHLFKSKLLKALMFFSLRVWQNGLGPSWTMLYSLCTCLQLIVLYLRKLRTGTNCNPYSPSCSFINIDICVECTCADPGARTHKSLAIMFFPNNLS